jgi:hypothetical protein
VESLAQVLPEEYRTRTELILPLRGRLLVWDGHDMASHHRRTDYSIGHVFDAHFQRYGYDPVLVDERVLMSRGPKKVFDDWYRGPAVECRLPCLRSGGSRRRLTNVFSGRPCCKLSVER